MIFLVAASSMYAQDEVKDTVVTKKYSKGDMIITSGVTMIASGSISWFASRSISIGLMSTGGAVTVIGIIVKVVGNGKR